MFEKWRKATVCDKISLIGVVIFGFTALWLMIETALLGGEMAFLVVLFVAVLNVLLAVYAWQSGLAPVWLVLGVCGIVLSACTNFWGFLANPLYLVWTAVALLFGIAGTAVQLVQRAKPRRLLRGTLVIALIVALLGGGFWLGNVAAVNGKTGSAQNERWAVPDRYDERECPEAGRVEELTYTTKAYASDGHTLTKRAYVYVPYTYDEKGRYDILYLMHGTGDDETYWLLKHPSNKIMLDNLIYYGDIRPVIVVTPTWYVEGVCEDDPDVLTYTFCEELRNDLIPAVESRYSTYAESTEREDLIASRDHRAFAGLSRGAATTWHSAYCGALDYFSMFGAFSGCLTAPEEFAPTQQGEWAEYDIQYVYNTSGTFDFLLKEHRKSFFALLEREKRLVWGRNCSFDVFPMVYHHIDGWHIALYNALQLFFSPLP